MCRKDRNEEKFIDAVVSLNKNTVADNGDGIIVCEVRCKTVTRKSLNGKWNFDNHLTDKTVCAILEISDSQNCTTLLNSEECHIQGNYHALEGGCLISVKDAWIDVKHSFVFTQKTCYIMDEAVPM